MESNLYSAVIYTGGECNIESIPQNEKTADMIIAADCGCLSAIAAGITPDVIIGDFDSTDIPPQFSHIEAVIAPSEKDETDTMLAVTYAIEKGCKKITVIGGTGGRIDHTLSNLFLLESLEKQGIDAVLTDGNNRVRVVSDRTINIERSDRKYFGVLALDEATVTLSGCKYPLTNAKLTRTLPFAVSNEITSDFATVSVIGTVIVTES